MKVYIKNTNVHPLKELFKGEEVNIEAGDFWRDKKGNKKELDVFEANDFRGTYHPVPFDGSGKMLNDPKYFKMIEMVPVGGSEKDFSNETIDLHRCMVKDCKHVSPSPEELEAHTAVRHGNLEKLILPEVDQEIKRRGPGRPPKEEKQAA